VKLIIEIDLDRIHHDTFTGDLDKHEAAEIVEAAAERVRKLDLGEDMLGCSYRLKRYGDTVGSITIQAGEDD
jgi:hypothetical protein